MRDQRTPAFDITLGLGLKRPKRKSDVILITRGRVVVGRERAENGGAAGTEFGSMILMVDVVVTLHPAVTRIME